jgi:hypothetical protein
MTLAFTFLFGALQVMRMRTEIVSRRVSALERVRAHEGAAAAS